jgi:diacylglycerol O-acyltransferase
MPITERHAAVRELVENAKNGDVSLLQQAAKYASLLPTSVVSRIARAQGQSIDFGTSNVKGADFPVFIAGAKLLQNHPFGPLAGAAFNVTLLSYDGNLDMGIHIDHGAVAEPEALREHIEKAFEELFALVPAPEPEVATESDMLTSDSATRELHEFTTPSDVKNQSGASSKKRRWFRKRSN